MRRSRISDSAARTELTAGAATGWGAELSITLHDGRVLAGRADSFLGCPERPMSLDDVATKFRKLSGTAGRTERLLQALVEMELSRTWRRLSSNHPARGHSGWRVRQPTLPTLQILLAP